MSSIVKLQPPGLKSKAKKSTRQNLQFLMRPLEAGPKTEPIPIWKRRQWKNALKENPNMVAAEMLKLRFQKAESKNEEMPWWLVLSVTIYSLWFQHTKTQF